MRRDDVEGPRPEHEDESSPAPVDTDAAVPEDQSAMEPDVGETG
jgi:hypothetical protein